MDDENIDTKNLKMILKRYKKLLIDYNLVNIIVRRNPCDKTIPKY